MRVKDLLDTSKELRKTRMTFFGRFPSLTKIQERAIPEILNGRNAFIVSPTASGKTEAVLAPLMERLLNECWEPISLLYITPTRALANDIRFKFKDQLDELDISLDVKTGDHPRLRRQNLPDVLVTTPESLDSIICRNEDALSSVRAVVLDEIHLIDNMYRGDQIRILLRRLRRIREDITTSVLSATASRPEEMAHRYMEDPIIIRAEGDREIRPTLCADLESCLRLAEAEDLRKILIFCNSRKKTEQVANQCGGLLGREKVVIHHGSLSKSSREDAESFIKSARSGVCVSTMTLEIGIDIGNVNGVVLADVPFSMQSFLQRIGRSNREGNSIRVLAIYNSKEEKIMLQEMLKRASSGELDEVKYSFDLSVIVQQTLSLLFQHKDGIEEKELLDLFNGLIDRPSLKSILIHLEREEYIESINDRAFGTIRLMDLSERGFIHSNIPDSGTLEVIEESSGRKIGEIGFPFDEVFMLAGKTWQVLRYLNNKVFVKHHGFSNAQVSFKPRINKGKYDYLLPEEMRGIISE